MANYTTVETTNLTGETFSFQFNSDKEDNLSPTYEIQAELTDEFKRGQLLIINGTYWLCLKSQCFHDMYWTGKLKQCTHLLRYQDIKTKALQSSWAVLERPYSRTLNNGKIITTSEMEFKAMLPFNENTKKINLDRRLLTGVEYDKLGDEIGSVYQITGRDASSQVINGVGFLVLNMSQVGFNSNNDNLDLMIADYLPPDTPVPPPTPDPTLLKCAISGSSTLKCGGSARSFKPSFYLADGITLDETVVPVWTVEVAPAYVGKIISTANGNSILLKCVNDPNIIGVKFKLKLRDDKGLYATTEIMIEVVDAFG